MKIPAEYGLADKRGNIAIDHFVSQEAADKMRVVMDRTAADCAPFKVVTPEMKLAIKMQKRKSRGLER